MKHRREEIEREKEREESELEREREQAGKHACGREDAEDGG